MSSFIGRTLQSSTLSSPRDNSNIIAYDEQNVRAFEFKPNIKSSYELGLPFVKSLASVNRKEEDTSVPPEHHSQGQDNFLSTHELTIPVSTANIISETMNPSIRDQVATNELQRTVNTKKELQILQHPDEPTSSTLFDKSAEDGYNWRKYGEKHVKGSEFPRSYYKCTHPNCQMKKQLERSHNGKITEIIYKGRHDHPKPQPNRRIEVDAPLSAQGEEKSDRLPLLSSADNKASNAPMFPPNQTDQNGATDLSPASASDDDGELGGGKLNTCDDAAIVDDPESKRRKTELVGADAASIGQTNRESRVVVQTVSEVDILDDGYRWRKYGQKVVKGNPNPRSYYKCTNAGCPVRKHVERASHDPKAVLTTYEGKHNHDVPTARNASNETFASIMTNNINSLTNHMSAAALSDTLRTCSTGAIPHPYCQPEAKDTINQDLGVGIRSTQGSEQHHSIGIIYQSDSPPSPIISYF